MQMQYLWVVNAMIMKNQNSKYQQKESGSSFKIKYQNQYQEISINESSQHFLSVKEQAVSYGTKTQDILFEEIQPLLDFLDYSQKEIATMLEVNPSTLSRWKKDKSIGKLRSKVMKDIDQVISKGIKVFGSASQFKKWLKSENPSFGNQRPIDLLKDPYKVEQIDHAIEAMKWGNFL